MSDGNKDNKRTANPEPSGSLAKLLIEQPDFDNQVGHAVDSKPTDQIKIDLLFLKFKEDRVSVNEFVEILFHQIINYALPIARRQEIYDSSGNALDTSKVSDSKSGVY